MILKKSNFEFKKVEHTIKIATVIVDFDPTIKVVFLKYKKKNEI
jgi:hypothetical protein